MSIKKSFRINSKLHLQKLDFDGSNSSIVQDLSGNEWQVIACHSSITVVNMNELEYPYYYGSGLVTITNTGIYSIFCGNDTLDIFENYLYWKELLAGRTYQENVDAFRIIIENQIKHGTSFEGALIQ